MKTCPNCKNNLIIRVAKKGELKNTKFWGCNTFPKCRYTESIDSLTTDELFDFNQSNHQKIVSLFPYNHLFTKEDIYKIIKELPFASNDDFFYWISKETVSYKDKFPHHWIRVGSPYRQTLDNLIKSINSYFNNIIKKIISNKSNKINEDLTYESNAKKIKIKIELYNQISKNKFDSLKEVKKEHIKADQRRSIKATKDIFNAIKRKDIKAIIALRKKGASLNIVNENELTAIELGNKLGNDKIIKALNQKLEENE